MLTRSRAGGQAPVESAISAASDDRTQSGYHKKKITKIGPKQKGLLLHAPHISAM